MAKKKMVDKLHSALSPEESFDEDKYIEELRESYRKARAGDKTAQADVARRMGADNWKELVKMEADDKEHEADIKRLNKKATDKGFKDHDDKQDFDMGLKKALHGNSKTETIGEDKLADMNKDLTKKERKGGSTRKNGNKLEPHQRAKIMRRRNKLKELEK